MRPQVRCKSMAYRVCKSCKRLQTDANGPCRIISGFRVHRTAYLAQVAETQDNIPQAHQRAVDAHFDSLSRSEKAAARRAGFRPYRELPKSGDNVFELDEAKACHRLRQDQGEDATVRNQTFDRAEVLAILKVVLDSIGGKRCAKLRGQGEVVRLGLGMGSALTTRKIGKLLGCSHESVVQQVGSFKARMEAGLRRAREDA